MNLNPFELNEQGNKIDLSKPEDVALTIKRNEALNKITTTGISMCELEFKAFVTLEFQCFKCGNVISFSKATDDINHCSLAIDNDDLFDGCKCKKCLTKYNYSWERETLKAKIHDIKRRNKMA